MIITVFMRKSPLGPKGLELTILGAGDAFGSRGRFQSAYIIESPDCHILMEVGPASLSAMKRMDFKPADIDVVLISHLHGDHFGGMPFLLLEYLYESPRRRPLTIAGPRRLEERTWQLFHTMFPGNKPDLERLVSKLRFVVLEPGCDEKIGPIRIRTIRTPHMKPDISLALRIAIGGKSIAFSGDTGWTEKMLPFVAGADLFLCECTYFESTQLDFHMNYPQLDANRARFDVGRMVLTHIGREVLDRDREVKLEMAHDGMRIKV
jgi:ribonuclease BN (tRNA processing enzyme)